MAWNYRAIYNGYEYVVKEVFYENGEPVGWTEDPIAAQGDTIEEVIVTLEMMLSDIKKQKEEFDADIPNQE